jgi:hypothetical protein
VWVRGEKARRFLALTFLAGALLLLPGCMTFGTINLIKNPESTALRDVVERVDHAVINTNNELLICVEARMSGMPHVARYTLIVPLSKIHARTTTFSNDFTNTAEIGRCQVRRTGIVPGWKTDSGTNDLPVFVGPAIPAGLDNERIIEETRPLPGAQRMVFAVAAAGKNDPCAENSKKFIYVDTSRPEAFTSIELHPAFEKKSTFGYYFLLPFAVAFDIATLPFQLILFLLLFLMGGGGMC